MREVLFFLLLTMFKIAILPFLFKEQKKIVLVIGFLFSVLMVSVFVLLTANTSINEYITWAVLVLLECSGYRLYMRCGWKKALIAGIAANAVFIGFAMIAASLGG